jgi:hypothetical protein
MSSQSQNPFKWRHFQADIILMCVRWYLRYAARLSRPRGNDAGAWLVHRSHHDLPLGTTLRARTGETLPTSSQRDERLVAR